MRAIDFGCIYRGMLRVASVGTRDESAGSMLILMDTGPHVAYCSYLFLGVGVWGTVGLAFPTPEMAEAACHAWLNPTPNPMLCDGV